MNTVKCENCKNYDVIRSGKTKTPKHGWCVPRSLYPFKEGPGQTFPANARRVESPEDAAKPEIVTGALVLASCGLVVPK